MSKEKGNSKEDVVKKKRVSLPLKGLVSGDMFSKGVGCFVDALIYRIWVLCR